MAEYCEKEMIKKCILEEYPLLERDRLRRTLDDIPASDVRPVVTCGECIHRHEMNRQSCQGRRPDFFCADGEKRGGKADG